MSRNRLQIKIPAGWNHHRPKVGLFIPCYIDQLYPQVGLATLDLLEQCPVEIDYPETQTCCGQPFANTGCADDARPLARRFLDIFRDHDYVVAPSASCVAMVRHHYDAIVGDRAELDALRAKTYELCEFLTDVVHVERIDGSAPFKIGLHRSCHGLRELRLGTGSERVVGVVDKTKALLSLLSHVTFATLRRPDECCGFGGTFAVTEEAVSCAMGRDRLDDHERAGSEVIAANDMSCLMHLTTLAQRAGKRVRVLHVAEILAGGSV